MQTRHKAKAMMKFKTKIQDARNLLNPDMQPVVRLVRLLPKHYPGVVDKDGVREVDEKPLLAIAKATTFEDVERLAQKVLQETPNFNIGLNTCNVVCPLCFTVASVPDTHHGRLHNLDIFQLPCGCFQGHAKNWYECNKWALALKARSLVVYQPSFARSLALSPSNIKRELEKMVKHVMKRYALVFVGEGHSAKSVSQVSWSLNNIKLQNPENFKLKATQLPDTNLCPMCTKRYIYHNPKRHFVKHASTKEHNFLDIARSNLSALQRPCVDSPIITMWARLMNVYFY